MSVIKEIVILSGKGGTGKTSFTAAFGDILGSVVLADCDVDAPDLHLLFKPFVIERHSFMAWKLATIDKKKCSICGECWKECRFGAINILKEAVPEIDPFLCEGCGVCKLVCPSDAVVLKDKEAGEWMISDTRVGPMVHATLNPGAENSGKLVSVVKENAKRIAKEKNIEWILIDGPPGTGCPVISSMIGVYKVLVITEPTTSGEHDLLRVLKLARHFNIPGDIIINKWDLNPELSARIESRAKDLGSSCLGKIPYDNSFIHAQLKRKSVAEVDHHLREYIEHIWKKLIKRGGEVIGVN